MAYGLVRTGQQGLSTPHVSFFVNIEAERNAFHDPWHLVFDSQIQHSQHSPIPHIPLHDSSVAGGSDISVEELLARELSISSQNNNNSLKLNNHTSSSNHENRETKNETSKEIERDSSSEIPQKTLLISSLSQVKSLSLSLSLSLTHTHSLAFTYYTQKIPFSAFIVSSYSE